jgi:hypothetical protein
LSKDCTCPRIRVAAIIQQGNALLMVRHQKAEHSYWLLPGGGVKSGETLEQALHHTGEVSHHLRHTGEMSHDHVQSLDGFKGDLSRAAL